MKIEIPGTPSTQLRMRHYVRGGRSIAFDPCFKEKARIRRILAEQLSDVSTRFTRPSVTLIFYFPIPESWSKKKKKIAEGERVVKLTRPDVDNLQKMILDCLTGHVWKDDGCVNINAAIRLYSPNPRTVVHVQEMQSEFLDNSGASLYFGGLSGYLSVAKDDHLD